MSGNKINPGLLMKSFQTNLLYALLYLSKVLNDSPPITPKLDNLTELDKRIKALKQGFKDAIALGNGFDSETEFTQQVLELDERVRTLKTKVEAIRHATGVLVQISRRPSSPHTSQLLNAPPQPFTKEETQIMNRLGSPIPFATAASRTPSPRLSELAAPGLERNSSIRSGSSSPHSQMMLPSQEDFTQLNDDINALTVQVKQHYHLKAEQKLQSKPVIQRHKPSKPNN